jgi:hypothetical protein
MGLNACSWPITANDVGQKSAKNRSSWRVEVGADDVY